MQYLSTRGHPEHKRFCEILLEGLGIGGVKIGSGNGGKGY